MKHAGPRALAILEALLGQVRRLPGLVEKKPGVFYRGGRAFLHFHEDPAGLFADLKTGEEFERFALNSAGERNALVRAAREALGDAVARRRS
jgi:hypothetical protein